MSKEVSKTRLNNLRQELREIASHGANYVGLDNCDLAGLDQELRNIANVTNEILFDRSFCPQLRQARFDYTPKN